MIDAAIPLATQQPQVTNPLSLLAQGQGIAQQQQNLQTGAIKQQSDQLDNQTKQIAVNQAQQGHQDNSDYRAAMAAAVDPTTGQVDKLKLLSTLGKLNPVAAAQTATGLQTQQTAAQEAQAKAQQAQQTAISAHLDLKDKLFQGVTDPITYANARNIAIQSGINPQEIPPTYDPAWVKQAHEQTLTQKDAFNQQLEQAKQTESARHDTATEAQTAATSANTQAYQQGELGLRNQANSISAGELDLKRQQAGVGTGGVPSDLASAIAQGHIAPDRMGYLLSKNPALMQGVMAVDPSFDSSKAAAYSQTYKDFTSGKTSVALNAGGTALGHLQELQGLNTLESRIPGTADHQAYENKVDTVATELAKFYGDSTVSGIDNIKKTLNSTFNRDAAIKTQAQSMGDKLDAFQQQWQNAAPSKAYEAPMPGISPKALAARQALAGESSASSPTPQSHVFSASAWQRANPKGDINAAIQAAKSQNYQVTQ